MSSQIDELYREKMKQLGGKGRVARLASLFESTQNMLRMRVLKQDPHLSEVEIKKQIARLMYRKDENLLRLIVK